MRFELAHEERFFPAALVQNDNERQRRGVVATQTLKLRHPKRREMLQWWVLALRHEERFIARKPRDGKPYFVAAPLRMTAKGEGYNLSFCPRTGSSNLFEISLLLTPARSYSNELPPLDSFLQAPKVYRSSVEQLGCFVALRRLRRRESTQQTIRSKMVKVCLKGRCRSIELTPLNGEPVRCTIRVELDHNVSAAYRLYDVQLFVPAEFAALLEVGLPLALTLEQNGS